MDSHGTTVSGRSHLGSLETLSRLLRTRANRYAAFGLGLGVFAILAATLLHCRYETGSYSLAGMLLVQTQNPALWALDVMPLVFLLWGQYIGLVMSYQASALVMDETHALREQASLLVRQLAVSPEPAGPHCELPGRRQLTTLLDAALQRHQPGQARWQVLVIATHHYTGLVQGGNSDAGAQLVRQLAQRLSHGLEPPAMLAHLGHDRFALMTPMGTDDPDGRRLAARLHLRFDTPVRLDDGPIDVRLHIGIAHAPQHGQSGEALLRHAETAGHRAVADGHDTAVYDPDRREAQASEAHLLADLHGALLHEGLVDSYWLQRARHHALRLRQQPQWPHPTRGMLEAHQFMDLDARDALLHEITAWQLDQGLLRLSALSLAHDPTLILRPPAGAWDRLPLVDIVLRLLNAHDHPPERLILELPVTRLLQLSNPLQRRLRELSEAGIRLSMSGQGLLGAVPAAALVYPLHEARLPADWLRSIAHHPQGLPQLRESVAQLQSLGLTVVVPGADRLDEVDVAWRLGADVIEGRAVQPPLPPDGLSEVLSALA